jgi:hypothetical protein
MKRLLHLFKVATIALVALTVIIGLLVLAPVNHTVPLGQPYYQQTMQLIDSALAASIQVDKGGIKAGFGKASITPPYRVTTAGYVKRKGALFTTVRDSVFVRVVALEKGSMRVAVVSLDMLIVPPLLAEKLHRAVQQTSFAPQHIYLSATHTHNSIGQWDNHIVGKIYAGEYDDALMDFLLQQISLALQQAETSMQPAALYTGAAVVREAVTNRLVPEGGVDSLLHALQIVRADSTRAMVVSYSAHATCLSSKDLRLSADYPGELVKRLEQQGYNLAMFLAGPVGSHAPAPLPDGDEKIHFMAYTLEQALHHTPFTPVRGDELRIHHIPLALGSQQIRISANWRVRPWLSRQLLGEPEAWLSVLQVGNVVLVGMPCDFSGMLVPPIYRAAQARNLDIWITSFNGGYIGYITPDAYYNLNAYETRVMNWYGPGNGAYLSDCLLKIIDKIRPVNHP